MPLSTNTKNKILEMIKADMATEIAEQKKKAEALHSSDVTKSLLFYVKLPYLKTPYIKIPYIKLPG